MSISKSTAVLAAADLRETVRFYCDVLGFKEHWLWGEPPSFGCIGLGHAELFLCEQPELAAHVAGHMHCFDVDDVQALYDQHVAAQAPIVSPLETKPWSVREYTVRDPSGYHLRFMGPSVQERPAAVVESLPSWIGIDIRVPDYATYASLFASVNWTLNEPAMRAALTNTFAAVLATDRRDGQVVGMARATGDGKYFMLWDVIVRPSHQGQKIGKALVQRLLDELRQRGVPKGAFVGLFTGRQGFYETLGFRTAGGMELTL